MENNELDPTYVSREEAERRHEQYEFACRVAGAAGLDCKWSAWFVTFRSAHNTSLREGQTFALDTFDELGPRKYRIVARPTPTVSNRGYVADVERMLSSQTHVLLFKREE